MNLEQRAWDLIEFFGADPEAVFGRLAKGFHENHRMVAEDFFAAGADVNDPESLLNWYRNTEAYIWELSAYHLEPGFNYSGMCDGIAQYLAANKKKNVLILGDGVGDLSIRCAQEGLTPTYNDLEGGRTAAFAQFLFNKYNVEVATLFTPDWNPELGSRKFDAVVAMDFFEHLVNVEDWANAVFKALKKNGQFMAQNAFACGDEEHGNSIPMHLSTNNRFEHDWIPLLESIGFKDNGNGWWRKP